MGINKLKEKFYNFAWTFFSEDPDPDYEEQKALKTRRNWKTRDMYVDTPAKYFRLIEKDYDKPRRIRNMPSVGVFIVADKDDSFFGDTFSSVRSQVCPPEWITGLQAGDVSGSKEAVGKSSSEYIAIVRSGCVLPSRALYDCMKLICREPETALIYSDEDVMDDAGVRKAPLFKPDYAPDLLMSYDYFGGFVLISRKAYEAAGGLEEISSGDPFYDLWLRISESFRVSHIDRVLCHRLEGYVFPDADPEPVRRALERRGLKGTLTVSDGRVITDYESEGKVSIIIPSKDHPELLTDVLGSLDEKTLYRDYEIIVVDNGSNDDNRAVIEKLCAKYKAQYIYEKRDFNFSYMCNLGASHAKGDVLVFLNDDIRITEPKWLGTLAGQARLPYSGAVGCLLVYPDGDVIQHGGIKEYENGPGHIFHCYSLKDPDSREARFPADVNGVTAACLAVRKEVFEKAGRFDESMEVCYNDVALCYDLINAGYVNCIRGDVCLIHAESVSRGQDDVNVTKYRRMLKEHKTLYSKHALKDSPHPFYNIHLSRRFTGNVPNYTKWMYEVSTPVREMTEEEISKWSKAPIRDDYRICFDQCDSFERVNIFGWAYPDDYRENYDIRRYFVIWNDSHHYIADIADWYRPDIAKLTLRKDVEYCGFRVRFGREKIAEGEYSISLLSMIGRKDTDKVLIV